MFKKMLQFVCVVVLAVVMLVGTTANATPVEGFSGYGIFSPAEDLTMTFGDNLMVKFGADTMSLTEAGYDVGYWHLALTNSAGNVVGYAVNSSGHPLNKGNLRGAYSGAPASGGYKGLSIGEKPVHAFLVYDKNNNGWDIVDGVLGSVDDLAEGDMFFNETQIIFGGVLGGIGNLPSYTNATAYLPTMTVVIPEPATICVLALGGLLLRKRSNK